MDTIKTKENVGLKMLGELVGVVIAVVMLTVILPRLSFVTLDYYLWLPIGIASTALSAMLKIVGHVVGNYRVSRVMEIGSLIVSFYSTYYLRLIFPFNFAVYGLPYLNGLIQFALGIALVAIMIGILVNIVRIFVPEKKKPAKTVKKNKTKTSTQTGDKA